MLHCTHECLEFRAVTNSAGALQMVGHALFPITAAHMVEACTMTNDGIVVRSTVYWYICDVRRFNRTETPYGASGSDHGIIGKLRTLHCLQAVRIVDVLRNAQAGSCENMQGPMSDVT